MNPVPEANLSLDQYEWSNRLIYRPLGQTLARLFRERRFAEVHEFLIRQLKTRRHPLADLCLDYEHRTIEVLGWPLVQAMASERDERTGELLGALQLNYSGQGDFSAGGVLMEYADGSKRPASAGWWMSLVDIEFLRDEQIFRQDGRRLRFSEASLEEISEAAPLGAAWPGRQSRGTSLPLVRGLEELVGLQYQLKDDDAPDFGPDGAGSDLLASWYFAYRWQDAIARAMRELGLPRDIPVIVGTFDLDPFVKVAHRPTLCEARPAPAPEPAPPSPQPVPPPPPPDEPSPEQSSGPASSSSAEHGRGQSEHAYKAPPKADPLGVFLDVCTILASPGPKGAGRQKAAVNLAVNVIKAFGKIPRR